MAHESRLRQKLREHRERAALEIIEAKLGDVRTGGSLQPGTEPEWVTRAIRRSRSIHTDPTDRLPDDTSPEELDAWLDGLLAGNSLSGRLYVRSHLGILPWLECEVPEHGWTARLRDAIEEPWMFLSGTRDSLVIVSEAEYCYEAHVSHHDS
ncbi:hypothetical protein ABB07_06510 [Streptomyces incarnatus]|uniref:Uncharacterized protein n=1 Tax=Streptomyces incarnatus TaxID=665007 RepID=A0ABM5TFN8_9ACTN|nr:hypothetical protein [Streptomyces incarnatus]AKJ09684.1 hypothetical protein ABB07_06510 [Streptomyces incarnatus]